jgi:hypothetical protein
MTDSAPPSSWVDDCELSNGCRTPTLALFEAPALVPAQTPVYYVFPGIWQSPVASLSC